MTPFSLHLIPHDGVNTQLMGFCDHLYGDGFATSNPSKLVQTSWIDPDALWNYLRKNPMELHNSDTQWLDPGILSQLRYLDNQIPTRWPVPKIPTGYIVDFSDSIWNEPLAAANGCIDNLLKDVDIESWLSSSGQGVNQLYLKDKGKEAKYYHCWQEFPDNGVAIFACYTSMLALLDDAGVEPFDDDTTFKRLRDLNKWKLVMFYKVLQRREPPRSTVTLVSTPGALHLALILAQVYINRETTDALEWIFDTLRELKRQVTGKDLRFKCFVQDGNLLVMIVDIEAAQILGTSRSLLNTNQPKYSGIYTEDLAEFATYFVKLCSVHVLCGIKDFRGMHLKSHDAGVEFTQFVAGLGIKKISDSWGHKLSSQYITKCMIKSQSNILPHHWDRTTGGRYGREDQVIELQAKLNASRAMRKKSMAMEKELQAELKAAKSNKMTQHKSTKPVVVSSRSSGRVKTTQVHTDASDKSSEPNINDGFATASTAPGESIIDFTAPTGITMDISLSPTRYLMPHFLPIPPNSTNSYPKSVLGLHSLILPCHVSMI
ncbi:hypothetical protein R3P38DRAFT_3298357 [Favolaschia claudopus]|uniref:Uncharacterized protein n=1 Tax=Favolaschia claudopus TaxID=2862362 RepID=A0AAV9Z3G0_9AGAR